MTAQRGRGPGQKGSGYGFPTGHDANAIIVPRPRHTYPRTRPHARTHARLASYPSPPPNNAVVAHSSPTFPIIYLSLSPLEREKKTTTCVSPSLGKSTP